MIYKTTHAIRRLFENTVNQGSGELLPRHVLLLVVDVSGAGKGLCATRIH
ncbi:MAG: hypothetical protein HQ515_15695 [Phycisphaeraceae bacterium]|nr:hypothetical protein [Phycisphaeraceae bacterium]